MSGSLLGLRGTPIAWSAVSEVAAMPVRHVLGRRAHVDVLPNAVDVGWWRDATPSSPADGRRTVTVVSVGRLAVRKRPLHLIDMMARVRERVSAEVPIRLVLVGDGPQRRRVERRVRHLGMSDWVDLPGQLTRAEIREVLVDSDVYAAPATLESFGIAALEARSVGLPVVAKAQGGVGEFVANGTDGVLARTDQDLAEALALLIESLTLRTEIRTHNIAVAPALGWGEALSRADALYARASSLVGHSSGLVPTGPLLPAPEFQAAQ
jgi:glycosyltransferase involved in cell wall biosynthesis